MSGIRDPLERVLVRFVDAVIAGKEEQARRHFGDAQALDLPAGGDQARLWAARERQAARSLVDGLPEAAATRLLVHARRVDG